MATAPPLGQATAPNMAQLRNAANALGYTSLSGQPATTLAAGRGSQQRLLQCCLRHRVLVGGLVCTYMLVVLAGAIAALGIAFYVSSLAADMEDAIHKVNNVYKPLLTATAEIGKMYTWGAEGAVWAVDVLKVLCSVQGAVPLELRPLVCGEP